MGAKGDDRGRGERVEVDDRGRITIPKHVREELGIRPGDSLDIDIEEGEIHIQAEQTGLVTVTSGKTDWGEEAFPDAETAMFGPRDSDREGDYGQ